MSQLSATQVQRPFLRSGDLGGQMARRHWAQKLLATVNASWGWLAIQVFWQFVVRTLGHSLSMPACTVTCGHSTMAPMSQPSSRSMGRALVTSGHSFGWKRQRHSRFTGCQHPARKALRGSQFLSTVRPPHPLDRNPRWVFHPNRNTPFMCVCSLPWWFFHCLCVGASDSISWDLLGALGPQNHLSFLGFMTLLSCDEECGKLWPRSVPSSSLYTQLTAELLPQHPAHRGSVPAADHKLPTASFNTSTKLCPKAFSPSSSGRGQCLWLSKQVLIIRKCPPVVRGI